MGDSSKVTGKIKVVLDTDIGSDIDDAVALAYLLVHPQIELVGITTVTGDVQKRAALCEILCNEAGKRVPIHAGRRGVLAGGPGQPKVPQYDKVSTIPHTLDRPENTAIQALRDWACSDTILLSVGPFGNLAAAEACEEGVLSRYKQVVSMAGKFYGESRWEWNCLVDPASTEIVMRTPIPNHLLVGLDVTLKCQLSVSESKERFRGPMLGTVAKMAEAWFEHNDVLTFHDPLAAASLVHPEICSLERGRVSSSWPDNQGKGGETTFVPDEEGRHLVCQDVSPDLFFSEYFCAF